MTFITRMAGTVVPAEQQPQRESSPLLCLPQADTHPNNSIHPLHTEQAVDPDRKPSQAKSSLKKRHDAVSTERESKMLKQFPKHRRMHMHTHALTCARTHASKRKHTRKHNFARIHTRMRMQVLARHTQRTET